jgi:hypothetical protein
MEKMKSCSCPHCVTELKKGCFSPCFCKPCGIINEKIKICARCKAQYSAEYEECPSCLAAEAADKKQTEA